MIRLSILILALALWTGPAWASDSCGDTSRDQASAAASASDAERTARIEAARERRTTRERWRGGPYGGSRAFQPSPSSVLEVALPPANPALRGSGLTPAL